MSPFDRAHTTFLFALYGNYARTLYVVPRCRDIASYLSKVANLSPRRVFLVPIRWSVRITP